MLNFLALISTCVCAQGSTENYGGPLGTSAGLAGRKNTCVHEEGRKPILSGTDQNTTTEKTSGSLIYTQNLFIWLSLILNQSELVLTSSMPLKSFFGVFTEKIGIIFTNVVH